MPQHGEVDSAGLVDQHGEEDGGDLVHQHDEGIVLVASISFVVPLYWGSTITKC